MTKIVVFEHGGKLTVGNLRTFLELCTESKIPDDAVVEDVRTIGFRRIFLRRVTASDTNNGLDR